MYEWQITSVAGKHKARKRLGRGSAAVTARHAAGDTRAAGAGLARTGRDCVKADKFRFSGGCPNEASAISILPSGTRL